MASTITRKAVVLLSGGIDSATAAARALTECGEVIAVSYNYGQKNLRELQSARIIAERLHVNEHFVVEVNLAQWGGSLLTKEGPVPSIDEPARTAHLTHYVPGRNTVFIAVALSLAEARGASFIYLGFNAADRHHPDTQPAYLQAFERLASVASKASIAGRTQFVTPFINSDKRDIVHDALQYGIPIEDTWSCYGAGDEPCGLCDACRIRDFALIEAGRPDLVTPNGLTLYEEETHRAARIFWRIMSRGQNTRS